MSDTVRHYLTLGGHIPEGYAFVADGMICIWNPKEFISGLIIEDDKAAMECRNYLYRNGLAYDSLDEVIARIIAEKWLGWEKLLLPKAE